jgi:hypothetical protein
MLNLLRMISRKIVNKMKSSIAGFFKFGMPDKKIRPMPVKSAWAF